MLSYQHLSVDMTSSNIITHTCSSYMILQLSERKAYFLDSTVKKKKGAHTHTHTHTHRLSLSLSLSLSRARGGIPRLTKIIHSGMTFVSRSSLCYQALLALLNVNNPVRLMGLPYVMWSAHFFVTHIQTEKISSWNGPTVHVCCFMLARASTKTFVSRVQKTGKKIFVSRKIR